MNPESIACRLQSPPWIAPLLCTLPATTVCFNAERHIREAMESVLSQTYPEIEYLVINGGSRDATVDVIRSFESVSGVVCAGSLFS